MSWLALQSERRFLMARLAQPGPLCHVVFWGKRRDLNRDDRRCGGSPTIRRRILKFPDLRAQ